MAISKSTLGKITLAAIVFGVANLDKDYNPLQGIHSALSAALMLAIIFFGDHIARWIGRILVSKQGRD